MSLLRVCPVPLMSIVTRVSSVTGEGKSTVKRTPVDPASFHESAIADSDPTEMKLAGSY